MNIARRLTLLLIVSLATAVVAQAQGGRGGGGGGGGGTQPAPVFSPLSYSATATGLGSTSSGTVNLINLGSAPLTISSITLGGANAADYTLGGTCVAGAIIPQKTGNLCTIQIAFHPTAMGTRAAALSVTLTNAAPATLNVTGIGLSATPQISVSTSPIVWGGATTVGSSAAPVTVVVQNVGAHTLTLNDISIGGTNSGDFVFAVANRGFGNCFAGVPLAPLSLCYVGVNFKPTDAGERTGTLNISSNDPATPVAIIQLSATALPAPPPPTPTPTPAPTPVVSAFDFTDLWANTAEPGWSISITHHKATTDVLTAFWQTFDVDGRGMWLKLTDGHWVDALTYTGNLHRVTGPAFSSSFDANLLTDSVVGTATITFADANDGTFSYTVNGISGSKAITRAPF